MSNMEREMKELTLDEMEWVNGGTGIDGGWEEQVRNTCIKLKGMGKSMEYAVSLFQQMQPDKPEIQTYIISIWDSI